MDIKIIKADYLNPAHKKDIQNLLNSYALDPMGGGKELTKETRDAEFLNYNSSDLNWHIFNVSLELFFPQMNANKRKIRK